MRLLLTIGICLFVNILFAQKANYILAEKFSKKNIEEVIGTETIYPNFLKNNDKFWYIFKNSEGKKYYFVDPVKGGKQLLFENEYMAANITKLTHKVYNANDLPINNLTFKVDEKTVIFKIDTFKIEYNIQTKRFITIPNDKGGLMYIGVKKPIEPQSSPDTNYVAFSKRHNIYVKKRDASNSTGVQLTMDGATYFSYASNESDTTDRPASTIAVWFNDSKKMYVLRKDNRRVRKLSLLNSLSAIPSVDEYLFALPGDKEVAQYELSIIDVANKRVIKVESNKWKDQVLTVLYASKKSDKLYFMRKRRTNDEIEICAANTNTGEVTVLINEVCKPYFNDQLFFCSFLNDGEDILLSSERTGWEHFYLYDNKGILKNEITSGPWVAGKLLKIDTTQRVIYFEGYGREKGINPYYALIYKVNMDGTDLKLLTPEDANHKVILSKSCKYLIDNYSRVDLAPVSILRDNNGKKICELGKTDLSRLYEMGWKMPQRFTVKAKDGITDLYGTMWKPYNFDSTKRYPIISYVYPGPQTEELSLDFTVTGELNASLAQVGFIVINMGHRGGSPQRNKWYHTYGYGNLRDFALADDKYGIEQLADRHHFIDLSKVGIFGHSGGGSMSTAAICTYPDFYTAAVSSSGNHDNTLYNQWWGETHQGLTTDGEILNENKKGHQEEVTYQFKVPTNQELAKNLKGHLLLVTGDEDRNVHPANTLRMVDALINAGKNFDLVVLPGQNHQFMGASADFFKKKLWFHFAKYLLGDNSADMFSEIDEFKQK